MKIGTLFVSVAAIGILWTSLVSTNGPGPAAGASLSPRSMFGWAICWIDDLNDDGIPDIAVSDPNGLRTEGTGAVHLLSGVDGQILGRLEGLAGEFSFGRGMAAIREVGTNRVKGLLVGGEVERGESRRGFVRCVDPATGDALFEAWPEKPNSEFGTILVSGEDVSGDGVEDVIALAPAWNAAGLCYLLSGGDGSTLLTLRVGSAGRASGIAGTFLGDFDKDGKADIAVGSHGIPDGPPLSSTVDFYSSSTGGRLGTIEGPSDAGAFGRSIQQVGDLDGDGQIDLAIGAPALFPNDEIGSDAGNDEIRGAVYFVSGDQGSIIEKLSNDGSIRKTAMYTNASFVGDSFGEGLAVVGATSKEGKTRVLVADHNSPLAGAVHCFAPPSNHRWTLEGSLRGFKTSDYHLGYSVASNSASGQDRALFALSTANPWGGEVPSVRVVDALSGEVLFLVAYSEISSTGVSVHQGSEQGPIRREQGQNRAELSALEGKPAPELVAQEWLNTSTLKWPDLKGNVVLLDFWGMWCGPCRESIGHLKELDRKYRAEGLVIIGFHTSRGSDGLAEFVAANGIGYPIAIDLEDRMIQSFHVDGYPDYYLIDRSGVVRYADVQNDHIEEAVRELLGH